MSKRVSALYTETEEVQIHESYEECAIDTLTERSSFHESLAAFDQIDAVVTRNLDTALRHRSLAAGNEDLSSHPLFLSEVHHNLGEMRAFLGQPTETGSMESLSNPSVATESIDGVVDRIVEGTIKGMGALIREVSVLSANGRAGASIKKEVRKLQNNDGPDESNDTTLLKLVNVFHHKGTIPNDLIGALKKDVSVMSFLSNQHLADMEQYHERQLSLLKSLIAGRNNAEDVARIAMAKLPSVITHEKSGADKALLGGELVNPAPYASKDIGDLIVKYPTSVKKARNLITTSKAKDKEEDTATVLLTSRDCEDLLSFADQYADLLIKFDKQNKRNLLKALTESKALSDAAWDQALRRIDVDLETLAIVNLQTALVQHDKNYVSHFGEISSMLERKARACITLVKRAQRPSSQ